VNWLSRVVSVLPDLACLNSFAEKPGAETFGTERIDPATALPHMWILREQTFWKQRVRLRVIIAVKLERSTLDSSLRRQRLTILFSPQGLNWKQRNRSKTTIEAGRARGGQHRRFDAVPSFGEFSPLLRFLVIASGLQPGLGPIEKGTAP